MTSGAKYRIVGFRLLKCLGLFCSLPGLLLPILGLVMVVGELAPGTVPWRGCLMRSFCQWCHLPSRSDEVDGLASPYTVLWLVAVY
jgi:hypothetical protein